MFKKVAMWDNDMQVLDTIYKQGVYLFYFSVHCAHILLNIANKILFWSFFHIFKKSTIAITYVN